MADSKKVSWHMKKDRNQEKVYIPLLREFKNNTQDLYKNLWISRGEDLSGVFIPHVFDDYYNAKTKVFFIGQDTYGWTGLEQTYSLSEEKYLAENNKWPDSIDTILEWTNPYTFWNFAARVQLALNGYRPSDLSNLSTSQRTVINQIGWGNLYSLEIPETVAKYGEDFNASFDHGKYSELLKATQKISKLKNVIDAFKPDYVVILAWKYVEDWLFEGLNVRHLQDESIPELLSVYEIAGVGTKIFWTYHPQALCRKSQDLEALISLFLNRKR